MTEPDTPSTLIYGLRSGRSLPLLRQAHFEPSIRRWAFVQAKRARNCRGGCLVYAYRKEASMTQIFKITAVAFAFAATGAQAQVSCNSFGTMTTCSNGLTAQRFGNQTIYNNGVSSQQFGNQTIYSDGLSSQRFGNQTIYNNGVTSQQFGNQTLFSNGTTCTRFGNQTICN